MAENSFFSFCVDYFIVGMHQKEMKMLFYLCVVVYIKKNCSPPIFQSKHHPNELGKDELPFLR